jgi:hypothetical protein
VERTRRAAIIDWAWGAAGLLGIYRIPCRRREIKSIQTEMRSSMSLINIRYSSYYISLEKMRYPGHDLNLRICEEEKRGIKRLTWT